jgi:hypothetical protein
MEWELTKRQNLTKPPKPTALFLYTDLKKGCAPDNSITDEEERERETREREHAYILTRVIIKKK